MYEVSVEGSFVAAHQIRLPDGSLEALHEHVWHVNVSFRGEKLDELGILIDFVEAKRQLDLTLADLAGTNLNSHPALDGANPTAELIARHIFDGLHHHLGPSAPLHRVMLEEAPGCRATYYGPTP